MRAIVAGGGIGGLCTAIALDRAGIEVSVFEKAADPMTTQVGGGFHIWGNAVRALRELGLEECAAEIGAPIERTEFHSWRGRRLAVWPLAEIAREAGAADWGVTRGRLLAMLYGQVAPGTVTPGMELTEFWDDGEGVTAKFSNGSEERADFLVGADGLRSAVRAGLLGKREPDYAGYTQWQTTTDRANGLLERGTEQITFGPALRTVVHHVGGGDLFWAAVTYGPESGGGKPAGRKRMLLERFSGWPAPITAAIENTPEEQIAGLPVYHRKPVKQWGKGRVTLLGDAAHPMTTNTGQGGNQAVEDAVVLAHALEGDQNVSGALRSYEVMRIARTTPLVKRSRQAAVMNAWSDPIRSTARDLMMRVGLPGPALRELRQTVAVEF